MPGNVLDGLADSRSINSPAESPTYYQRKLRSSKKEGNEGQESDKKLSQASLNDKQKVSTQIQIKEMLKRYERAKQLEEERLAAEEQIKRITAQKKDYT